MIEKFLALAYKESQAARDRHGRIRSTHEGLGLLEEEFWEVKLEVFKKCVDKKEMLKELSQVAALCARMAEDCGLMEEEDDDDSGLPDYERYYCSAGQTQDSSRKASE